VVTAILVSIFSGFVISECIYGLRFKTSGAKLIRDPG